MWPSAICFSLLWIAVSPSDYYYLPLNVTRSIAPGIAAVRSALTLDWLDAEDSRQRQVVQAYQTGSSPPSGIVNTDCVMYPRPAAGKIGRLLLEMLKNLEGDDGRLVVHLVQSMVEKHILVESTLLDSEPNLESLVKIPKEMLSEPYHTFPRVIGMIWLTVTDPVTVKQDGWCAVKKVRQYLATTKPRYIAKHMKYLDPILARIRYIMEEFILNVTPLSMFHSRATRTGPMQATPEEISSTYKPTRRKTTTTTTEQATTTTFATTAEEYPEDTTTETSITEEVEETTTEEKTSERTTTQEPTTEETTTEEITSAETTTEETTTEETTTTTEATTTTTKATTTTSKPTSTVKTRRITKATRTTPITTKSTTTKRTTTTKETTITLSTLQWFNEEPTEMISRVLIPEWTENTQEPNKLLLEFKPESLAGTSYSRSIDHQISRALLCFSLVFVLFSFVSVFLLIL